MKVEALPLDKYLKDDGVTLVNKYASIKLKIDELKDQQEEFKRELDSIGEAAIKYAQKEGISKITGSDHLLRIVESEALQFPLANEEKRDELEQYVKKAGIWDQVSSLSLSRLTKMVEEESFDKTITDQLLTFGERITKATVKLTKMKVDDE
jgi:hypothetical protein